MDSSVWNFIAIVTLSVAIYGIVQVYRQVKIHTTDRGEPYKSRMCYLPNPAPDTEFDLAGVKGWIKRMLHNELIDQGPYIVDYSLCNGPATRAILIMAGGGYVARSEQREGVEIAEWLNQQGVSAFILNYRLQQHPTPLQDAQLAISYIRDNAELYNIDPHQIGVMGFSSGGHLAAISSTHYDNNSRPDFTILAYPVIYMNGKHSHGLSRLSLIGADASDELSNAVSPHLHVTPDTPPAFIWTTKNDFVIPWQNAQCYAQALQAAGVEHTLHIFPKGQHGSALAQNERYAGVWPEKMLAWLNSLPST